MALQFSGSGQYLAYTSALVTTFPYSFACWFKPATTSSVGALISVGHTTTAAEYSQLYQNSTNATAACVSSTAAGSTSSTPTLVAGTWYHFVGIFTSATSRQVYLNGIAATVNNTNKTPTPLNKSAIAGTYAGSSTPINQADGQIAYPCQWNVALTSTDVANLYNAGSGVNPSTIENAHCVSFLPLASTNTLLDSITSVNWSEIGSPTQVVDPFSITGGPTVAVQAASSITVSSATLNGNITNENGFGNSTTWGFNWGLTPSYGSTVQNTGSFGTGIYGLGISGLAPGITYHYQAFATNPGGTGVSADQTFQTTGYPPANKGEVLYNGLTGVNILSSGTTSNGSTSNMFDGNSLTTWGTSSSNAWVGINVGAAVTLTRLRYSGQPVFEDLVVGSTINASASDPTFASPTLLYTFPNTGGVNGSGRPNMGTLLNEVDLSLGSSTYQYYMLQSPGPGYGFSDLDFIGNWVSGVYSQPVQPVITPGAYQMDQPVVVSMSCITSSATIYYTLDGSMPTTSSTVYAGPFVVSSNTQVNAISYDSQLSTTTSRLTTAFYLIPSVLYAHVFRYDDRGYKLASSCDCILYDPVSGWYYQYLLAQDDTTGAGTGHNVYRSADLRNWIYSGNVCGPAPGTQLNNVTTVTTRMQVYYCAATGNYVSWSSQDNFSAKGAEVWYSSTPDGTVPWTHYTTYNAANPMGDGNNLTGFVGDTGGFVDPVTGNAYIMYTFAGENSVAFSQLDPSSYLNTLASGSAAYGTYPREAHCMTYHNGTYFWMSSATTGFAYNTNEYGASTSPIGPWSSLVNPMVNVPGGPPNTNCYDGQSTHMFLIPGRGAAIWTGDDLNFNSGSNQEDCTKLMLPVTFSGATMSIKWQNLTTWFNGAAGSGPFANKQYSPWSLDTVFPTISGAPQAITFLQFGFATFTWLNHEPNPVALYLDYSTSPTFATVSWSEVISAGTTLASAPTSYTPLLTAQGTGYYRIRSVNVNGTSVSAAITVTLLAPSINILDATNLQITSATLNANLVSQGTTSITTAGFNFGLTAAYGATVFVAGPYSAGILSSNITGLAQGTLYHFQAFATNSEGTTYTADDIFSTVPAVQFPCTTTFPPGNMDQLLLQN